MLSKLKVGIAGFGVVGKRRRDCVNRHPNLELVAVCDQTFDSEGLLSDKVRYYKDYKHLLLEKLDVLIVCLTNEIAAEVTIAGLELELHVFCEKPPGRNVEDILRVIQYEKQHPNLKLMYGFNHRYHRSLQKAKKIIDEGQLGELMFVRARYGHGGRLGYEKEWRAKPELSGGGELIDQGVHLIDLSRWILGDFSDVQGRAHTYYWDMPVDDNAFLLMKTPEKKTAFLHVSCTEWKNTFSMEIYGRDGKLDLSGLGGSYGTERLSFYKMLPEMGPPETTMWEYPMADNSWAVEFKEFLEDIRLDREPAASLNDAYQALKIVDTIYEESEL